MDDKLHKFDRKEGIEYLVCEHLESGLMESEATNIWLGDNRRVILCPLCEKIEFGRVIELSMMMMGASKGKLIRAVKAKWKAAIKILDARKKELEAE